MRKFMRIAATACLAAGMVAVGTGSAHADTLFGDACQEQDFSASVGTTVVLNVGGCYYDGWDRYEGDPTVVYSEGGGTDGQPLIWYQSVGRTGSTCADGWTPSYAEWPNDGKGGPTCDKSIVWGMGPGDATGPTLSITINDAGDWVWVDSEGDIYVTGCDWAFEEDTFWDDHVIHDCFV